MATAIWIIFIVYNILISIGIGLSCKRVGIEKWKWACLPFVSFFFLNRLTGGFKSCGIVKIKNWGMATIYLICVAALCHGLIDWGNRTRVPEDAEALTQIMMIFIVLCIIIFYLGCIGFTKKILFVFKVSFKFEGIICALFITLPFILMVDLRKYTYERKTDVGVKIE